MTTSWPERENCPLEQVAAAHVTLVLANGDVEVLNIPAGGPDFLDVKLQRTVYIDSDGASLEVAVCTITANMRRGSEPLYTLRRIEPDGTVEHVDVCKDR